MFLDFSQPKPFASSTGHIYHTFNWIEKIEKKKERKTVNIQGSLTFDNPSA